jgi:hypothetical protein
MEPQLENLRATSVVGFSQYAMNYALTRMWCGDVVFDGRGELERNQRRKRQVIDSQ